MNLGNTSSKLWKLVCPYLSYLCILGNVASGGPGVQGTFLMKGFLVSNIVRCFSSLDRLLKTCRLYQCRGVGSV